MNRAASLALLLPLILAALTATAAEQEHHPARAIIKFEAASSVFPRARAVVPSTKDSVLGTKEISGEDPTLESFFSDHGIRTIRAAKPDAGTQPLPGGMERIFIIELTGDVSFPLALRALSMDPDIELAEPDYVGHGEGSPSEQSLTNDPYYGYQWGLENTGQIMDGYVGTPGIDIDIDPAWNITTGNPDITVAVLDTGIPLASSEFAGRILPGYDFVNDDDDASDDYGHGSNVSSVACAEGGNGSLIAGVNWKCQILPVKVLNSSNWGYYSWWISGLTFAADQGADVINMSMGGLGASSTLESAVTYAVASGALVIASMMNEDDSTTYYPAGFSDVIAVGAINNRGLRAVPFCWGGGSSFGSHIDFSAPGDYILGLAYPDPTQANYWCGTSQATPMVTGVVALIKGVNGCLSDSEIYSILQTTARDQVGSPLEDTVGWDAYHGWGLIDAGAAVQAAMAPAPTAIVASDTSCAVALTWNWPGSGQTGFRVYRDDTLAFAGTDSAQRAWTDTWSSVNPGTYSYSVAAYSPCGEKLRSEADTGTSSGSTLLVSTPGEGETWSPGQMGTIEWTASSCVDSVEIELSRSGETGPWESLFLSTPNDGEASWPVSGPGSSACYIRVSGFGGVLSDTSSAFNISDVTGVAQTGSAIPVPLRVFPNPSRSSQTIEFDLTVHGSVRLYVVDVSGRRVETLLEESDLAEGYHRLDWTRGAGAGSLPESGVFFVILDTPGGRSVQKIMRLR